MADLEYIRQKFIERSGRIDLVGESGGSPDYSTDAGADWFINEGIRELDSLVPFPINTKQLTASLTAGNYSVSFANLRAPLEVYSDNGSDEKYELCGRTERELRDYYEKPFSQIDSGEPVYWAISHLANDAAATASMTLTILPPADATYTITAYGHFWSDTLSDNTDTNWWTVNHPGLAVLAALYMLEVSMRNREGARDWMAAITQRLSGIEFDVADREASMQTELEG